MAAKRSRKTFSPEKEQAIRNMLSARWRPASELYNRARRLMSLTTAQAVVRSMRESGEIEARGKTRNREFRKTVHDEVD